MTDLFGIKVGTPSVCADLLGSILEVQFRRVRVGSVDWYIAENKELYEVLILAPNKGFGDLLEPYAPAYEVLLYIARSGRQSDIVHRLASETTFRFLDVSLPFRHAIERVLDRLYDENGELMVLKDVPETRPRKPPE